MVSTQMCNKIAISRKATVQSGKWFRRLRSVVVRHINASLCETRTILCTAQQSVQVTAMAGLALASCYGSA